LARQRKATRKIAHRKPVGLAERTQCQMLRTQNSDPRRRNQRSTIRLSTSTFIEVAPD
jgi:hypothetical protein